MRKVRAQRLREEWHELKEDEGRHVQQLLSLGLGSRGRLGILQMELTVSRSGTSTLGMGLLLRVAPRQRCGKGLSLISGLILASWCRV